MKFLRNSWYVACRSTDLVDKPLGRVICDEPVCLYRLASGEPAIISNVCPHRKAPLSMGYVEGDLLRCRYHGMGFNREGRCVHIPSQDTIPSKAHIRSFKTLERYGLVWIWPGDQALSDESLLPDLPWRLNSAWNVDLIQYFHVKAPHRMMSDNLLDLSHVAFLHADSIGFDPRRLENDPLEVTIETRSIKTRRVFRNTHQALAHKAWQQLQEPIDRIQEAEWTPPGNVSVLVRNQNSEATVDLRADHFITPEMANTHHYYVALARNFRIDDATLSLQLDDDARRVHQEDVEIAEAQKTMAEIAPDVPEMALRADKGVTASHRILAALAAAETR